MRALHRLFCLFICLVVGVGIRSFVDSELTSLLRACLCWWVIHCRTHDALWNTAQLEMVSSGYMNNYLR